MQSNIVCDYCQHKHKKANSEPCIECVEWVYGKVKTNFEGIKIPDSVYVKSFE